LPNAQEFPNPLLQLIAVAPDGISVFHFTIAAAAGLAQPVALHAIGPVILFFIFLLPGEHINNVSSKPP
jgi:hypothetical protein